MSHTRFTLQGPYRYELEVKRSRFVAHAAPITNPEDAFAFLQKVRDAQATHNCWAYKVGAQYRFSDDGEPAGTAGRPILSAIQGQDLEGVVVVVIRYFGGIKLGAGGLVRAYGGVASECLRQAPKRPIMPRVRCELQAPFEFSHALFHLLEGLESESETYNEAGVCLVLSVEETQLPQFQERVRDLTRGRANMRIIEHFDA